MDRARDYYYYYCDLLWFMNITVGIIYDIVRVHGAREIRMNETYVL